MLSSSGLGDDKQLMQLVQTRRVDPRMDLLACQLQKSITPCDLEQHMPCQAGQMTHGRVVSCTLACSSNECWYTLAAAFARR